MITITTGNLTEFAWIVMGVWAAVTIFREVFDGVKESIENKKYWKKRYDDLNEAHTKLYNQHQELKAKTGHD
jgi:hypothetical protein